MAFSRLLRKLLRIPLGIFRKALRLVTVSARPWQPDVLPVGGMSLERLSALLFALRQVSASEQVGDCNSTRQLLSGAGVSMQTCAACHAG